MSEEYTHLKTRCRMASKPHKCTWCGEVIEPKTLYQHQVGRFDGHIQDDKYHLECYEKHEAFCRRCPYPDEYYEPGDFIRGSDELRDGSK